VGFHSKISRDLELDADVAIQVLHENLSVAVERVMA
jgi:hypothetical protein